jgi:hypothetical protein
MGGWLMNPGFSGKPCKNEPKALKALHLQLGSGYGKAKT